MHERHIRKLTPAEKYRLGEMFKANAWPFDDRGDCTSFTEEEMARFLDGKDPFNPETYAVQNR